MFIPATSTSNDLNFILVPGNFSIHVMQTGIVIDEIFA